jgi:ketosteroid isomerase-like protein
MPQENVEVVRDALDALGRGGLDAMADYWTDDVEHRAIEGAIDDRGPMQGCSARLRAGLARQFRQLQV